MNLTEKQHQAVFERNKSILVSAAAGSGKTSVLSERIAVLCEEGADIRNMLVCTFTNLAAGEMRSRISQKLLAKAEETGDARLRAQADYAASAEICTFHSFAIRLLRENFLRAGLPQRWRVASEYTARQLKDQALEETFVLLTAEQNQDLRLLLRRYADKTETGLKKQLLRLYDFTRSLPEQLEWIVRYDRKAALEKCRELYFKKYDGLFEKSLKSYEKCTEISRKEGWEKQILKDEQEYAYTKSIHEAYEKRDFAEVRKLFAGAKSITRGREIPNGKAKDRHKFYKDDARDKRKALSGISLGDLDRLEAEGEYMHRQAQAFYNVLKVFDGILQKEKLEKGLLDYDDIISRAYELLMDDEVAAEYRKRYDYVFVDEYQDTNPIQDAVVAKISRGDNLFIVGDIKQSIYRFRLADPLIFREKQEIYEQAAEQGLLIRMNDNFRSAPQVIDGINKAMYALMSRDLGEIDYTEEEALCCGKKELVGETEFLLTIPYSDELKIAQMEAAGIAGRIRQLHEEENIPYSDIAVLLRSVKGEGDIFAEVFRRYGIPAVNNAERDVPGEVELFLNLLRVVDNVNSDIALLSVMRSHLGSFDEQELAEIRGAFPNGSYYSAVKQMQELELPLGEKCKEFLDGIKVLRIYSRSMRLSEFLILLKNRTRFEERITLLPHGMEKAEVFRRFFEDCLAEAGEKESLYHLLSDYDDRIRRGDSIVGKGESFGADGCVRIMTVHASKGLEFPVVFFARLDKRMNESDLSDTLLFTSELGIVSDIIDEDLRMKKSSLLRSVLRDTIEDQLRSELLRVVYVAMTRAKNRLILSACCDEKGMDGILQNALIAKACGSMDSLKTPLAWMAAAYSEEELMDWQGITLTRVTEAPKSEEDRENCGLKEAWEQVQNKAGGELFAEYAADSSPIKYSVTSLMPEYIPADVPEQRPERKPMGGAEFGSLVHYFMEHADFKEFEGVDRQVERMISRRLITENEGEILKKFRQPLEAFFCGETAERIRRAEKVYRELPFNLSIPAKSAGKDGEGNIVVQGIIDMIFEEDGKWVIVDYKSNFITAENRGELVEHYAVQMELYRKAAEMITGKPVSESVLCFLRAGMEERIMF